MISVKIHPVSIDYLKKGHYWITEDSFTKKFPLNEKFIQADLGNNMSAILFNDPQHKKIKARLFKTIQKGETFNFEKELKIRLTNAIDKRKTLKLSDSRDNYYLVFSEADALSGLYILNLNDRILIQYYSEFWSQYEDLIIQEIKNSFTQEKTIYRQYRLGTKQIPPEKICGLNSDEFIISEYGVHYKIFFKDYYDHGIYTDMAAIRNKMLPTLQGKKKALNLYSYTGAFSLYFLKNGIEQVTSVDLSKPYLNILEENLKLNNFAKNRHHSICANVKTTLEKLKTDNNFFDLIVCDPPSFSSDGNKNSSALTEYDSLILLMDQILNKNGIMILFLNTHSVKMNKFTEKINQILKKSNLEKNYKLIESYKLSDDCPTIKGFDEGNYLKGLVLKKI